MNSASNFKNNIANEFADWAIKEVAVDREMVEPGSVQGVQG